MGKLRWFNDNGISFCRMEGGRIERDDFPMGGYFYTAYTEKRDGGPTKVAEVYSGNDLAKARAAIAKAEAK